LKAPRHGFVKTRLAADIGNAAATKVYRELAERQVAAIPAGWSTEIQYTPRGARAAMVAWLGSRPSYRLQRGGDLGARLAAAFAQGFHRGDGRVIAVGADCPDLDTSCLTTAAASLKKADVAIGPARDGGYYLIGLRRPEPDLFAGIRWGSSEVLTATLDRAQALGATVALLDEKEDIDDAAALGRYRQRQQGRTLTAAGAG
jgi:rSAM/selenodomain-associated transferase 1